MISNQSNHWISDCRPTLTGKGNRNENYINICADNAREGDDIEIEVEFEAVPKPDKVEWIMQEGTGGRNSETLDVSRRDESKGNYEAFEIEEDVSTFILFCT